MKKILVLNGPNLDLAEVEALCRAAGDRLGYEVECFQSNSEGALVDKIQEYGRLFRQGEALGCVFNPGAFAHSSVDLHDAIEGVDWLPVIECHVSNVPAGQAYRRPSTISPVVAGMVAGFGAQAYLIALEGLVHTQADPAPRAPAHLEEPP